ncbi:MAG TPA: NAD(P)-binding protein [Candidatus Acidoferrum sp.]|jgi:spermidine dehydrogenase|nr:NAD(P)-binding protein [Candidatus Acidoferrum sp.]
MSDLSDRALGDRELGMKRNITRRDFLNGVAVAAGAALMPWELFAGGAGDPEKLPDYYPPALTGLRGSHPGSFDAAHSLRDGTFWDAAGAPQDTGETYDLIVVGGGISGLSAAHFYRKVAGANARVLILDNHDDFGGHAKRNEFRVGDAFRLGFGGTFSIESPAPYSKEARGLIEELGIDVASYPKYHDAKLYQSLGLRSKIFFDKETFGVDKLVSGPASLAGGDKDYDAPDNREAWKKFLADSPLDPPARSDLDRLRYDSKDYFPDLSSTEKKAKLARVSYAAFLRDTVKVHDDVVKLYQAVPQGLFGVGIDAVSAQDAWGLGLPGFAGMKLDPAPGKGMNRDTIPNEEAEKYFFHFPDGNASIARLLVRKLIPDALPGNSWNDVVLTKANYSKLDSPALPVKIRLNSTAVRVKHVGDAVAAKEVEVAYARGGKVYTAKAKNCILACWHVVIPYICEDLPQKQKDALASAQKVPLLYTNVALRNWTAFQKLNTNSVYAPGCYHTRVGLDLAVSIGGYECARKPGEPIVIHMMKTPCKPGRPARDQHTAGRIELYNTTFETMERKIREQLARTLGAGGFDPARDIAAITVNRWPHGYAYEYNSLFDSFWLESGETPCEVARKTFGRIGIANADAGAYAYTDEAINQAWRAVRELKS